MSRALLYPIPDWPGLSVACTMLSSVNPGKSLSRDLIVDFSGSLLLQDRVAVHPEDVVDTPRLSRGRTNSVCGFWHTSTRSCIARHLLWPRVGPR